jgi:phosphatidylglycerophosphatase A
VAGYILFRLFDIYKPWLVARAEQLPYAWGIMLDDCVAALFAWILLHTACWIGLL